MSNIITAEHLNLNKMFQSFYYVPAYQREYIWGEKGGGDEVMQFLNDIYSGYIATPERMEPEEYFIGTIVVHKGSESTYNLIDGQQRTTTLFLLLCALRYILKLFGVQPPETMTSHIFASYTDWQGKTTHRARVALQYADARDVLELYSRNELNSIPYNGTRTIRNLADAYETIYNFLIKNLKNDPEKLKCFYGYIVNKVVLVRIETLNMNHALKVFETTNDRGVSLGSMDLLKNLLFMTANSNQFDNIKADWVLLTHELYQVDEKPLQFLRYFILARYDVKEALHEDGIYDWLINAKDKTGYERNPLGFVKELRQAAQAYACFVKQQNPFGKVEHGLLNLREFSRSFRMHYILLLAGYRLSPSLFTRLCDNLEQVVCVWLLAGVPATEYGNALIKAAERLRTVQTREGFDDFVHAFFNVQKQNYAEKFAKAIAALKLGSTNKRRTKYLLAKVVQHFDIDAFGKEGREALAYYLAEDNEIEHILPQQANPEVVAEFGEGARDRNLIHSLGNLLLLEGGINSVVGNAPYSRKAELYPLSNFLVSRCQSNLPPSGKDDRITKAMKKLNTAPVWNRQAIEARSYWYAEIVCEIMGIPRPVFRNHTPTKKSNPPSDPDDAPNHE